MLNAEYTKEIRKLQHENVLLKGESEKFQQHQVRKRAAVRGVQWVQLHPSIFEKASIAPINFRNLRVRSKFCELVLWDRKKFALIDLDP